MDIQIREQIKITVNEIILYWLINGCTIKKNPLSFNGNLDSFIQSISNDIYFDIEERRQYLQNKFNEDNQYEGFYNNAFVYEDDLVSIFTSNLKIVFNESNERDIKNFCVPFAVYLM